MAINSEKLHELLGKAVVDFGATFHAALVQVGDKLGLYKALAAGGPQTSDELAKRTGTTERYVREWLSNQAAGGYVTYDSKAGKFSLSEEQAFTLADENSPAFLPGMFQVALAAVKAEESITERFKTGKGLGWHEHHHDLFRGTERFFRPGYAANLVALWIPALEGVMEKLERGATLPIRLRSGRHDLLMAKAYRKSEFSDSTITTGRSRPPEEARQEAGVGRPGQFKIG